MTEVKIAAIIPARMASSRFPGKPLLQVRGLPMIEHVRRRVERCRAFSEVVVATCDREIAEVVERHRGRVVMTSPTHQAATDRVAEAAERLSCTHVINVQGDEILILPRELETMASAMAEDPGTEAWNAVARLEEHADLSDRSVVKCAVSRGGRMLLCSRDFSRLQLGADLEPIRRVLGILGSTRGFLRRYGTLARTPLEITESIDQSRMLEHDVAVRTVEFRKGYPGINEPREVELVETYLAEDAAQRALLQELVGE